MVEYCGCLVRDEWVFQRGADLVYPYPVTVEDIMDMLLLASEDVMIATNVYC